MPRARPSDRFEQLRRVALRVLARQGLRRTRMADLARELRLSPGSLYNYVESKEALFYWLVEHGADATPLETPAVVPLPTPAPGELERRLRAHLEAGFQLPALAQALARRQVGDARGELCAILTELWDLVARTRGPMAMLERSALDLPELFQIWFVEVRRAFFERFARYVAHRVRSGHFRAVADPAIAARMLVETIVYFARHRHGDPDPTPLPDDDAARAVVLPMLVASLVPDPAPH